MADCTLHDFPGLVSRLRARSSKRCPTPTFVSRGPSSASKRLRLLCPPSLRAAKNSYWPPEAVSYVLRSSTRWRIPRAAESPAQSIALQPSRRSRSGLPGWQITSNSRSVICSLIERGWTTEHLIDETDPGAPTRLHATQVDHRVPASLSNVEIVVLVASHSALAGE